MAKLEDAVERIKRLECPTGEIENRVAGILVDYGVAKSNEVKVNRNENLDREIYEAYSASISNQTGGSIVVLAKAGMDDYVAKVVDAYISDDKTV